MDFGIYENITTNELDYSWFCLPWMINGYHTKMQEWMGEVVKDCLLMEISNDQVLRWLNMNPFVG